MTVFLSTLGQIAFLLLLIAVGYLVAKLGVVDSSAAKLLSSLENNIFIPALVLGTFMQNFTLDSIGTSGQFLLCGLVVAVISIPLAILGARCCSKDAYIRKIYTYGLAFSNFGFMGNAVVKALFPDVFMHYLIFVLPLWFFIYLWGVPALLIPAGEGKRTLKTRLKPLLNPMFAAVILGAVLGIVNLPIPGFVQSAVTTLGDCMSPVAMLLTGMTIAKIKLKPILTNISIYAVSALRLLVLPLLAILALKWIPISDALALCTVCALAMPLGLNTIVVPSAYGKDTSVAAGMALISHVLSGITIPLVFWLFQMI